MYEICPYFTNDGSVGLFSQQDDDIYHSTYGALTESWQKFVLPAHLKEYLETHSSVKILDICYGIGYNTKTALQVFLKNILENNKNKSKNISAKITSSKCNNEAIYTNNISGTQKIISEEIIKKNYTNEYCCNSAIDSDNISASENIKNYQNSNFQSSTPGISHDDFCNDILIDAVDIDKILISISPFIVDQVKSKSLYKKYLLENRMTNNGAKNKLDQIQKMNKKKLKLPPKEFRLRKEVSIIILEKLIEANPAFLNEQILKIILNNKSYTPFIDKFMLNLAKFHQYRGCKYKEFQNKVGFLHNIYYRYISKSYKRARELLKNSKISLNFHNEDARRFIKGSNNKYNFIFLDAFTPSKCPALWTVQFFKELYAKLEDDGMILTYSNSAAIRNAFCQNGFCVGKIYSDETNKFVGTVATKNKNLIEYELDEKDLDLINSKAGICYRDENLESDNATIISIRDEDVKNSNLKSSTKVLKGHKIDKAKPI